MEAERNDTSRTGTVCWVNGPVVRARGMAAFHMLELVMVGEEGLVGEIIELREDQATIQVYEDTSGLKPGEPVAGSGAPLSLELGPGLIGQILDGIQRPLERIRETTGTFIRRGSKAHRLDRERKWAFEPRLAVGAELGGGEILGVVPETALIEHRVLVPPTVRGRLKSIVGSGEYTVKEAVASVETTQGDVTLTLMHEWQVRKPRPIGARQRPSVPLITGQRIVDVFFPLAKGGTSAIPGGFGTGKTVTQHNLAKWSDADIIVYIGCGERGNEMTGVLTDFPQLQDPQSGQPLTNRTILIANTSNMPVAAREASIYTGVTLAEYYRDMGYHVAVMADSTSRWAEALREIAGRLEEMPAEEGFPAYLATRLAEFYERAGRIKTLGGGEGSVSIVGAVSPPGGDFSEPVTQHTKRFVRCFWELDKEMASARFFPAINVIDSYSEYHGAVEEWWERFGGEDLKDLKRHALEVLRADYRLQQIVRLIGEDALPDEQRMTLLAARLLKEGFLQQDAFDPVDRYAVPRKQVKMLKAILRYCDIGRVLVRQGVPIYRIRELHAFQTLMRMKSDIPNDRADEIDGIIRAVEQEMEVFFHPEEWLPAGEGLEERQQALARELGEAHTRDELYELAKEQNLAGRSGMSKEELALRLAERQVAGEQEGTGE